MPLLLASHAHASPALLSALTSAALSAHDSDQVLPLRLALLANPSLNEHDTALLVAAHPGNIAPLAAIALRPGLGSAQFHQVWSTLSWAQQQQLHHSGALLPAAARSSLVSLLAQAAFDDVKTVNLWTSQLLADPALEPEQQRAALHIVSTQRFPGPSASSIAYAATKHPAALPALIAGAVNADVVRALKRALTLTYRAYRRGWNPTNLWLDDQIDTVHRYGMADLIRVCPDAHLAYAAHTYSSVPPDVLNTLLTAAHMPQELHERAVVLWRETHRAVLPGAAHGLAGASAPVVAAYLADALTWESLVPVLANVTLTPAQLDVIMASNRSFADKGHGHLDLPAAGAWLATHPDATDAQRAQGLAQASGAPVWESVARVGTSLTGEPAAQAGGRMPVDVLRWDPQTPSTAHVCALVSTHLGGALGSVRTPERVGALLTLLPRFTGTVDELLTTVGAIAP